MSPPALPIHRFRQEQMATTFEIRIAHENANYARQASLAAFQTTARLEALLSRYREDSEISQIRHLKVGETLRLHADTLACLELASEMQRISGGAFDPGLGAHMDLLRGNTNASREETTLPRGQLILEPENFLARCLRAPVNLDLGAIGKGFALDRMADDLAEWDIDRALLIAGGSSILALDGPNPDSDSGWETTLAGWHQVMLRRNALSSSGTSVKGAHILDPRDGSAAQGPCRTWALASSAAVSDALCTAWMLLESGQIQKICSEVPDLQGFLQPREDEPGELVQITTHGISRMVRGSPSIAG